MALAVLPFLPPQHKACAQNLESNVCDPDIWKTMVGRAWIEAQREVEITQSFITQPDSVLELSCFDAFAHHSAGIVGSIFSDSDNNGALLKTQVGNAAIGAAAAYLAAAAYTQNPLGGGTMSGYDYNMKTDAQFSAQCNQQMFVWINFKCKNMVDLNGVVFDQMKDNDPRAYYNGSNPQSCADVGGGSDLFDAAATWESVLNSLNTPAVAQANPNYFDVVQTFSSMTAPTGACSPPIPTGVQIVQADGSTTAEMVCPNPGCSFNGASCAR
ncbi:MAG: hypothetical protein VX740_08970 [Pseudomonadota bacterium]|nr:hypothetical protein [Pseudomonadota bacterium]